MPAIIKIIVSSLGPYSNPNDSSNKGIIQNNAFKLIVFLGLFVLLFRVLISIFNPLINIYDVIYNLFNLISHVAFIP